MSENKRIISVSYPKFNPMEENPYQEEMDKLLDISITEANSTRSIKNITECLAKSLKSKYGIKDKEELKKCVHDILKLHGLAPENFDPLSTISKLTFGNETHVNDVSIDDNANKTSINMEGICGEAFLPYKKVVGYDYLYQTLKELYGIEAEEYNMGRQQEEEESAGNGVLGGIFGGKKEQKKADSKAENVRKPQNDSGREKWGFFSKVYDWLKSTLEKVS